MNIEIYAKVGTIPMNIIIKNGADIKKGDRVKFRENEPNSNWETGYVTDIEPMVFIEKM